MRLIDCFDRGADLHPQRGCRHVGTRGWRYAEVRGTTHRVANGLKKDLPAPYWAGRERKI